MTMASKKTHRQPVAKRVGTVRSPQSEFQEVLNLIESARNRAIAVVNTALIDLYWRIGQEISRRIDAKGWGQGTVHELAEFIRKRQPNARGFSASNLWRMMQFYETYCEQPKLAALLREMHPDAASIFKDAYLVEFLDLPPEHTEADLQLALVEKLKHFLIELGRDFCYIGSQYPIQVGGRDFAIDLVFFNHIVSRNGDARGRPSWDGRLPR
jgi:predicted nuclease of restriction endonuclease-like (RecB) superfamily